MNVKRISLLFSLLFLTFIVVIYTFKSPIASYFAHRKLSGYEKRFGVAISFKNLKIDGIRTISISNINVTLPNDSVLLNAYNVRIKLAIAELIQLKANPLCIGLDSMNVNFSPSLLSRLSRESIVDSVQQSSTQRELYNTKLISRIVRMVVGVSTSEIDFSNVSLCYSSSNYYLRVNSKSIKSNKGKFFADIETIEDTVSHKLRISGLSDKLKNSVFLKVTGDASKPVFIPLAENFLGMKLRFDSLAFSFSGKTLENDSISFSGFSEVHGLNVFHRQLSESEVFIDSCSFLYNVNVNQKVAALESGTTVTLNKFKLPLEMRIENKAIPAFYISSSTGIFKAVNLFESLPGSLFSNLVGIKVQGDLLFELNGNIDFAQPDSLSFTAKLSPFNFHIQSFGNVDFRRINDTLTHTVYVNDSTCKYIYLYPDYKYFTPTEQISPHVKNAVITAEDGGFFTHNGFDAEGFQYALAQNIKQRRMARGGSTITMQLVKNLYLNHSKNLVRKAEEALIVWLIETEQLVSKDRILEIYLNIIEWGPNINGITEAAEFYFDKKPSEIELNEAIFLASIVPKPSSFMQNFDSNGNLKPFMTEYYNFIAAKMLERGAITEEEYYNLTPNVRLKRKALEYIANQMLTNITDSLIYH